jgi:hypothetical protein
MSRPTTILKTPSEGFVFAKTIIDEITAFKVQQGEPKKESTARARTTISDFIKYVNNAGIKKAVLNMESQGKRQLSIAVLGPWLWNRTFLKGFTSVSCPFTPPTVVCVSADPIRVMVGQVLVNPPDTVEECHKELREAILESNILRSQLVHLQQKLAVLQEADKARRKVRQDCAKLPRNK